MNLTGATKGDQIKFYPTPVSAGFPGTVDEHLGHNLDLNSYLIDNMESTYFVRVSGDSMTGAGIYDGDILIVDRSKKCSSNDIIVAYINSEFTVKRLIKKTGAVLLKPENSSYPTLNIREYDDFQLWGKVTYSIHKAE
jgi:DNA polymerase V